MTDIERGNVRVDLFSVDKWSGGDWMPENLGEAILWFQSLFKEVPQEHRESACISINENSNCDESSVIIEVYYFRPETDGEFSVRLNAWRLACAESLNKRRASYERLRDEFEPTPPKGE